MNKTSDPVSHAEWVKRERARLQREMDYESSRLREANEALDEVEKAYGNATRALEAFNKGYGR
jgi:predicted  nucleic acid-binding Zn-ribbon protein